MANLLSAGQRLYHFTRLYTVEQWLHPLYHFAHAHTFARSQHPPNDNPRNANVEQLVKANKRKHCVYIIIVRQGVREIYTRYKPEGPWIAF